MLSWNGWEVGYLLEWLLGWGVFLVGCVFFVILAARHGRKGHIAMSLCLQHVTQETG